MANLPLVYSLFFAFLLLGSINGQTCGKQTDETTVSCGALYNIHNCPSYCCVGEDNEDDPSMGCFMPSIPPFVVETRGDNKLSLVPSDPTTDLFGGVANKLSVDVNPVNDNLLQIKITAPDQKSYSVPTSVIPRPNTTDTPLNNTNFQVTAPAENHDFFLTISTNDTISRKILHLHDLYWSDDGQYIQFSLGINALLRGFPEESIASFGIGESSQLTHKIQPGQRRTLWNSDLPCSNVNQSLYGSHPVLYQVREGGEIKGKAHGLVLVNSNGMDVSLAKDNSQMTFQISGGEIELYLAAGPTPANVSAQLQNILALDDEEGTTARGMPPYWSFGFHNCKYGYTDIGQVEEVYNGYVDAQIPYDTQWMDIDYMDEWRDFTYDPVKFPKDEVKNLVNQMIAENRQYVPIVDPGILVPNPAAGQDTNYSALQDGLDQNVFVRNGDYDTSVDDSIYAGYYVSQVWPGATLSPDWFHPNSTKYWQDQLAVFHDLADYRGLWIDMNEFANFCAGETTPHFAAQKCTIPDDLCPNPAQQTTCCLQCEMIDNNNTYDFPPFVPHGHYQNANQNGLGSRTIVASAQHHGYVEYDVHNLFGLMEAIATNKALVAIKKERPFVLSRSTFLTSGKHTAHWTGDNYADWENLRLSIVTVNNFGLFNMPMLGADMCGFMGNTTEELCNRWVSVASFHPFTRNHNNIGQSPQELYLWDSVTECARRSFGAKYTLLPWLNWLFFENIFVEGPPPVQALWQSFPEESPSFSADTQFTWGGKLLISPVVTEGEDSVEAFFPNGIWYDYFAYSGDAFDSPLVRNPTAIISESQMVTLPTPLSHTNVHVYQGSAFMKHAEVYNNQTGSPYTVTELLNLSYSFVAALDDVGSASGHFMLDDGVQNAINKTTVSVNSITVADQLVTIAPETKINGAKISLNCFEIWASSSMLGKDFMSGGCFATHGISTTTDSDDFDMTWEVSPDGWGILSMCLQDAPEVELMKPMYFAWGSTTECAKYEEDSRWWHSLATWQQVLFIIISALIGLVCLSIIGVFICFALPNRSPESYDNIN